MQRRYVVRIRPMESITYGPDSDGIYPMHPYNSRGYPSTSHRKRSSRRTGFFLAVWVCVFACFLGSRSIFQMTRRALVSRVLRVQRRYAVRTWPMASTTWAHCRPIFDLLIVLYMICTHLFHMIRRAVVSRVLRVQRRYTVQIRRWPGLTFLGGS